MRTSPSSKTRFDARLSIEQKELFEKAASLSGYSSLTDFVLKTVQQKAQEIVNQNEKILASKRDSELFFSAILSSQEPSVSLSNAAASYLKSKHK